MIVRLRLFGHKEASEVIGNDMLVWLPEEEHERVRGGFRLLCEHGAVRDRQYTLQRKDGTRFAGEIQATSHPALRQRLASDISFHK